MEEAPFIKGQLLFYLHHSAACQANLSTAWQLRAFLNSPVCVGSLVDLLELQTNHTSRSMLNSCSKDNPRCFVAPQVLCFLLPLAEILIQGHQVRKIAFFFPGENTAARTKSMCPCVHATETKRLLRMMEYRQRRAMHRQFVQLYK